MIVSSPVSERRRSRRETRILPLSLHTGQRTLAVRSVDVSDDGALVVCPEALSLKFGVVLDNPSSGRRTSGWVVRCVTGEAPGTFEVAIEFIEPAPGFWESSGGA